MTFFLVNSSFFTVVSHPTTCTDSRGHVIELNDSNMNDNYCDCDVDGVDEELTSACSFLSESTFVCKNVDDVPKSIFSSRVNDGVSDLCRF